MNPIMTGLYDAKVWKPKSWWIKLSVITAKVKVGNLLSWLINQGLKKGEWKNYKVSQQKCNTPKMGNDLKIIYAGILWDMQRDYICRYPQKYQGLYGAGHYTTEI